MAGLVPFARIVDLESDSILASTTNLLDYAVTYELDKVGSLSVEVGAGDPGDAGGQGFAAALLEAATDLGSAPKPLLLEFSLDGGAAYDSRKVVEQPVRSLKASQRTIKEEAAADLASILATIPVERVTFTDCRLQDVFNGAAGTIAPIAGGGLVPGPIPYLHGLLTVTPGLSGWAGGHRLKWTAVINPDVADTATNVDINSATTLAACETIVNRLAGAAPGQRYGHYVADPSDASLNLGGRERAFVVGNIGPAHLTFDATSSADVDETTTARLHLDSATLKSDDSALYHAANMVGGKSTAGFPDQGKITALTVLNGTADTQLGTDWRTGVPLIGINVGDAAGGLFFTVLDGTIRPVPGGPQAACQSLAVDHGDDQSGREFALLMGTPHGCYAGTDVDLISPPPKNAWALLGDLNADIVRLNVKIDPADAGNRVVFALIKGTGERTDGLWRWTAGGGPQGTWDTVLQNTKVIDFVATDYKTIWTVLSQPQDTLYRHAVDAAGHATEQAHYALPSGGQIAHIQEVVTVNPDRDSVWALTEGSTGAGPAYYLVNDGSGNWGTWHDANQDGTLHGPDGTPLRLNRAVGLGVAFEGTTASVLVGSDQGVYGTTRDLGGNLDWKSLNEQGGLANYNVRSISAGEAQTVLTETLNRVFCVTEDDLLYSNSTMRWWSSVKGADRTDMGPHLSALTVTMTGDLPPNNVRTWGTTNADGTPMWTSPLDGSGPPPNGTHVYVDPGKAKFPADVPPDGYYWLRYLDQHRDYQYALVNDACPFSGVQMEQLPALQSNAAVDADRASAGVMQVAKRWLQQHSTAQTQLVVESSFSTAEAALRTLRPTHLVHVNGSVAITDITGAGEAVTTHVWEAQSAPMYVLAHSLRKGPGMTATCTVTLGTELLATPVSAADMANALTDSISSVKIWRG